MVLVQVFMSKIVFHNFFFDWKGGGANHVQRAKDTRIVQLCSLKRYLTVYMNGVLHIRYYRLSIFFKTSHEIDNFLSDKCYDFILTKDI